MKYLFETHARPTESVEVVQDRFLKGLVALRAEREAGQREDFLQDYGSWMENIFGEGWEGNARS